MAASIVSSRFCSWTGAISLSALATLCGACSTSEGGGESPSALGGATYSGKTNPPTHPGTTSEGGRGPTSETSMVATGTGGTKQVSGGAPATIGKTNTTFPYDKHAGGASSTTIGAIGTGGTGTGSTVSGVGGSTTPLGTTGGKYAPCPTNGDACRILPLGDSITNGMASTDKGGYRAYLFKLALAANQKITFTGSQSAGPATISSVKFPASHEGYVGWTIDPGFSTMSGVSGISTKIPTPAFSTIPHIVLLMIGTNDTYASKGQSEMATRLEGLLDRIIKAAPDALIVLATLTPMTVSMSAAAEPARIAYNEKIPGIVQARAAKGQHIMGVDMSKMPSSQLSDGVHPNDSGYAYMADVWYEAIKDLLPK